MRLAGQICFAMVFVALAAACSSDGSSSRPIFGTEDRACTSVRLLNEENDAELVAQVTDCLIAEIEAGREVTVDVAAITVEGDPLYNRYAFDGEQVLIVADTRADQFGSGGVSARRCLGVERTRWLPEGFGCASAEHDGFPEAG